MNEFLGWLSFAGYVLLLVFGLGLLVDMVAEWLIERVKHD